MSNKPNPTQQPGLQLVPRIEVRGTLVRCVALVNLVSSCPPNFLYASGRPNRYNPAGVDCVYFADQEAAARLEYAAIWGRGAAGAKQPFATYSSLFPITGNAL